MAAKIFPFGTPLTVVWHLTKPDGTPFSLNGYSYNAYYKTGNKEIEANSSHLTASGNTLSIVIPAAEPVAPGEYAMRLVLRQNGNLFCTLNYNAAFVLSRQLAVDPATQNQEQAGNVVHLYTVAEYYLLTPIIPTVGDDGYWYVNGAKITDGSGEYIPASHTVEYDQETNNIIIDRGRVDSQGESIEQTITVIADVAEEEAVRQENEKSRIATEARMKNVLDSIVVNFLSGTDLYEQAVEQGYQGTKDEWLSSPLGIKGVGIDKIEQITEPTVSGAQNVMRVTLNTGEIFYFTVRNGARGERGLQGPAGATGAQGLTGATGQTGPKGDKGDKGDSGVTLGDVVLTTSLAETSTGKALDASAMQTIPHFVDEEEDIEEIPSNYYTKSQVDEKFSEQKTSINNTVAEQNDRIDDVETRMDDVEAHLEAYSGEQPHSGPSSNRPDAGITGYFFFDTTLGKPVWWAGEAWVDATGTAVE